MRKLICLLRLFLLLLFLLLRPSTNNAQFKSTLDSLTLALANHTKSDTIKVNLLNALSRNFALLGTLDSAGHYANKALAMAGQLHFNKGTALALRYVGNNFSDLGDDSTALIYYKKALKLCRTIDDKQGIVYNLINIGAVYRAAANYAGSFKFLQLALDVAQNAKTADLTAQVYIDIAETYMNAAEYAKALASYQSVLKISEKANLKTITATTLQKIGWLYRNTGDSANAIAYLNKALTLNLQIKDTKGIADCYSSLGNIYTNYQNINKGLSYYKKSIALSKAIGDLLTLANEYTNLSGVYMAKQDYGTAINCIDSAGIILKRQPDRYARLLYLQAVSHLLLIVPDSLLFKMNATPTTKYKMAEENLSTALVLANSQNNPMQKLQVFGMLTYINETLGNYKDGYNHLKALYLLKDSIAGQEARKKVVQKEMQYNFEKKSAADKVLQEKKDIRQRTIRKSLLAGLSFSAVFLLIVFRQNNRIKKEQKRSENLLLNILPAKVAAELKINGKAQAQRFEHISVLFTDFVNFTGASEALTPEQIVGELHECFTAFDYIIEKNGLEKIKTIGDAYMAVSGLPSAKSDHAQRAVQAAIEIVQYMQNRAKTENAFGIRVGINSGPVVAGIVGVKKFAYDIWGDTVNTAARMEQKSESGRINMSQSTYELVKNDYNCSYRGELEAKNKGKLKMYFVEGLK